jgi:hypothetical protein
MVLFFLLARALLLYNVRCSPGASRVMRSRGPVLRLLGLASEKP